MNKPKSLSIAMVWEQFAAYHIDRCEAVARRFAGRADVLAVELVTSSETYAWEPSGEIDGARKVTLFAGKSFEDVSPWQRARAIFGAVRGCDVVCLGISYAHRLIIPLVFVLRLTGKRVIVFNDSKFDDKPRGMLAELAKMAGLSVYSGAIVSGRRSIDYFRYLGFDRRPVLPGYDTVGLDRVRKAGGGILAPQGAAFADRPFIFVGRFVAKKNLLTMIDGYARYAALAGDAARRLVLVGAGDREPLMRARIDRLGIGGLIDMPGFLGATEVTRMLAGSLALVLVSQEEQWGLVVNEALAFGLPVIASTPVGARDALVRSQVNGFVVDAESAESIGQAMHALGSSREVWERMVAASHQMAWMGDAERLADAIECILDPASEPAASRIAAMLAHMEIAASDL